MKKCLKLLQICLILLGTTAKAQTPAVESLERQLEQCRRQREALLQQHDHAGCLESIKTLHAQLHNLEAQCTSEQQKVAHAELLCTLANNKKPLDKQELVAALQKSHVTNAPREKFHHELSALERSIAQRTQELLHSLPIEAKQELQSLCQKYHILQQKLHQTAGKTDTIITTTPGQTSVFDVLFI